MQTLEKLDQSMEVLFPEYFHSTDNISILWNWTKLWKLNFPTFFYNIFKIVPYIGRGPVFPVKERELRRLIDNVNKK